MLWKFHILSFLTLSTQILLLNLHTLLNLFQFTNRQISSLLHTVAFICTSQLLRWWMTRAGFERRHLSCLFTLLHAHIWKLTENRPSIIMIAFAFLGKIEEWNWLSEAMLWSSLSQVGLNNQITFFCAFRSVNRVERILETLLCEG